MADFGFLSDTDDSAIEELISQAEDLSVLEQVSAINCSGFTDSVLPTDLESRFRKLKSFPVTKAKAVSITGQGRQSFVNSKSDTSAKGKAGDEETSIFKASKQSPDRKTGLDKGSKSGSSSSSSDSSNSFTENAVFSSSRKNPDGKTGFGHKSKHCPVSSPSGSSNSCVENAIFSPSKQKLGKSKILNFKSKSQSFASPSNSWIDSPSPPRDTGCFWCSPKRVSRRKKKENRVMGGSLEWGKSDEFLSDLSTFSVKEQQKMLKKAMKEQEKLSQEADKIVQWAKQASARMSFHGIEDELSDDETRK